MPEMDESQKKDIQELVASLAKGSDDAKKLKAARRLAKLAERGGKCNEAIVAAGALPLLVGLIADGREDAQVEAATVLCRLTSRSPENAQALSAAGGIPPLVALLANGKEGKAQHTAALGLKKLAEHSSELRKALAVAGAIPALVAVVAKGNNVYTKEIAANALGYLASEDPACVKEIAAAGGIEALQALAKDGAERDARDQASDTLKRLGADPNSSVSSVSAKAGATPQAEPALQNASTLDVETLRAEVRNLEDGKDEEKVKAAEQLGTWSTVSDENRVLISKEGGASALVAVVVTGSDDAKWHAARALRHLANNVEAKKAIVEADGITTLTPLAKHGKGKVKEAADEALKLLSQKEDKETGPASEVETAGDIPNGAGTCVAMFSARFDGGPMEQMPGKS